MQKALDITVNQCANALCNLGTKQMRFASDTIGIGAILPIDDLDIIYKQIAQEIINSSNS